MASLDDVWLRPIRPSDDPVVASIIRDVMTEHGASGPGFAIHDPEVSAMSEAYAARERSACFVVDTFDGASRSAGSAADGASRSAGSAAEGGVLGCAAIAPLEGGPPDVCELRKMYFRSALRGRGAGRRMLRHALRVAASLGFSRCYLETLASMTRARALYESEGFEKLCAPLGNTGHFACDMQYARSLEGLAPEVATIETPRLRLRGPRPSDVDAVLAWLGDPIAMRYVGDGRPRSRVEAAHFLAASADAFESRGVGFWLVELAPEERAARSAEGIDDRPIGDVGLWPIPRSGRRGFRGPELELGYRFATAHHGRGYATEAARAVLEHARARDLSSLVAVTHPDNLASRNVLTKCGFAFEGVTERYYDTRCATFRWSA